VILLQVDIKEQLRRVAFDSSRPLLQTDNPEARLQSLMEEREPIYKALANVEISTDSRRMYHVVTRILRHLKKNKIDLQAVSNDELALPVGNEPLKTSLNPPPKSRE